MLTHMNVTIQKHQIIALKNTSAQKSSQSMRIGEEYKITLNNYKNKY